MTKPLHILIAGGGIAGLTAALACLKAGFTVEIFEQAPELSEIGAGIQIGPNAARVLHALDLLSKLEEIGSQPASQEMRFGPTNLNIFRSELGAAARKKYGAPYYLLHRADLISMLGDTVEKRASGSLKLGKTVSSYRKDISGVTLQFEDGSEAQGDVIVAADGIHSVLRGQMMGKEKPRFTGNIVWRAMVPATERLRKLISDSMCIWVGPEKHCVTYWLRGGEMLNFVGAVERDDWTTESWFESGDKSEFAQDFGGWSEPISAVIEAAEDCSRWALFDRDPQPRWTDGPVALVGDACHPMLPFLAQGAAMAIEDAWVLVAKLQTMSDDIPAALNRYETERLPRASKVQGAARARMHSNHQTTAWGQVKTYAPMWFSSRLTPDKFDGRFKWLFEKDVVAENRR
ncbi:MAG: FAD-dependent monooxygenase [Parasphingorhabdus sp.]